ncbi:MAG TPA: NHL repeat-containing protein, partial [Candidatus Binataceae bacterium]|nr:NHL repeat-containing protein [Candidatus Binataceae bacterium]
MRSFVRFAACAWFAYAALTAGAPFAIASGTFPHSAMTCSASGNSPAGERLGLPARLATGIHSPAARCVDPTLANPEDSGSGLFVADIVLGQLNFTNNTPYLPAGIGSGGGVAIDKSVTPNRVYFADSFYNRILAWNDAASFANGQAADLVLGQADFYSVSPNPTGINASGLSMPEGIAVDSSGNVYVDDTGNNRVLEYNTPFASCSSPPCVGPAASVVFGQGSGHGASGGDFTTANAALGRTGLNFPVGVALDSHNNLFVADELNSRVLEYDAPLATPATPNVTANRVYGQGSTGDSFDTATPGVSQTMMLGAVAVALDPSDNLYASDEANRVCEFDTPLTNFTMNRVFGQGAANNFTGSTPATTQSGTKRVFSLGFDSAGDLFISDTENARVLEFVPPFPSGSSIVNAAAVWGQGTSGDTFTTSTCYDGSSGNAISASTMCSPAGVAFDTSDNLYAADFQLQRILRFQPATSGT